MTANLKTALLELAQTPGKRSIAARVAEHFAEIENAFASGVSRIDVLDTLNQNGILISLKTFDNVLYRLRKKQAIGKSRIKDTSGVGLTVQGKSPSSVSSPSLDRTRPSATQLPDDWMTAKLTPEQFRLLSPKQRKARVDTETAKYFPNRFHPT